MHEQIPPAATQAPLVRHFELDEAESLRDRFARHLAQTVPGRKEFVVAGAEGCYVFGADGRRYLDLTSGIGVTNLGHNHPAVVRAITEQAQRYAHVNVYGRFVIPEQVELVERLVSVAGPGIETAYLTCTGAESTECALKLARKATGRPKFVAFERSYHGRTFGALSVSWREEWRRPFEPLLNEVCFVPFGDLGAATEAIDDRTAGVIVEPVQGEGGIRIPPPEFLPGLRTRCDQTGALLLLDEVQGGMGRSGRWFAHQHSDVRPDVIIMAKAVGGGLPLGAVLASHDLFQTFVDPPLSHLTTMGGNPVACAAGCAAFDVIADGLLHRVQRMGGHLRDRLRAVQHDQPDLLVDVRGVGLWCAIELSVDANPVVARLQERGVLVGSVLNQAGTIRIMPPLVIGTDEIDEFIGTLSVTLAEVDR